MLPEFRRGLPVTFLLALIATAGRVVVPIAVQQTIDKGLSGPDGPDLGLVRTLVLVCAVWGGLLAEWVEKPAATWLRRRLDQPRRAAPASGIT